MSTLYKSILEMSREEVEECRKTIGELIEEQKEINKRLEKLLGEAREMNSICNFINRFINS